jgi:hypothetical protein
MSEDDIWAAQVEEANMAAQEEREAGLDDY